MASRTMIRIACAAMLISMVLFAGCTSYKTNVLRPPQLSARQREAMQTKEITGDFHTVFSATISVLQDEGWQIDTVDKSSGIIQASSLKRQDVIGPYEDWYAERDSSYREQIIKKSTKAQKKGKGPGPLEWTRWEQLTAHIEPWGEGSVRERISITRYGALPSNTYSFGKEEKKQVATVGGKDQSLIVENPATYQYLYQQIKRAAFVRQGLGGKQ